jgi:hypothetical protein
MKAKRDGCVAQRIAEKMNASVQDLSVEALAFHIYGDATWNHRRYIRRTIRTMARGGSRLPEGWGLIFKNGTIARVTRTSKEPRGPRYWKA